MKKGARAFWLMAIVGCLVAANMACRDEEEEDWTESFSSYSSVGEIPSTESVATDSAADVSSLIESLSSSAPASVEGSPEDSSAVSGIESSSSTVSGVEASSKESGGEDSSSIESSSAESSFLENSSEGVESSSVEEIVGAIKYELAEDGNSYEVVGLQGGSAAIEIVISATYDGKSVTAIRDYAFYKTSVTSVTIPDSVTRVGAHAFAYCQTLVSVTIPDSLTHVGAYAFACCRSLVDVELGDRLIEIGAFAFCDCTQLQEIIIPESVTALGEKAFQGCSSLEKVTFESTESWILVNATADVTLAFVGAERNADLLSGREKWIVNKEEYCIASYGLARK